MRKDEMKKNNEEQLEQNQIAPEELENITGGIRVPGTPRVAPGNPKPAPAANRPILDLLKK